MFKNCCGCTSKKTRRKESKEEEDDEEKKEEMDKKISPVVEEEKAPPETDPGQKDASQEVAEKKPVILKTSMKKAKPRLSICTEVKIIPTNFPEGLSDLPDEGDIEEGTEDKKEGEDEEEEEDVEPEGIQMSVKNIDGKIIRKSVTEEAPEEETPPQAGTPQEAGTSPQAGTPQDAGTSPQAGTPQDAGTSPLAGTPPENSPPERPVSPLSDEVFSNNGVGALEFPLNNMGVRLGPNRTYGNMLAFPPDPVSQPPSSAHNPKNSDIPACLQKWLSDDEDEMGGVHEPPATPVAKDELALRRHRFFSELLSIAQAATEHRVRFDPFGPSVEPLSDQDQGVLQSQAKEFEALLVRLENITTRLETAVPALEKTIEPLQSSVVVTKSLEDLLDEHLTTAEKKNLNILIGREEDSESKKEDLNAISPDSSADVEDLSDKDITLNSGFDRLLNGHSDRSENSSNSQSTVVKGAEEKEDTLSLSEYKTSGNCCETELPDHGDCEVQKETEELADDKTEMTNNQSTLSMSVQGFQDILQGPFATYLQLSEKIGGDVAAHAKLVQQAFQSQLQYLTIASQSAKPSEDENTKLLKPTSDHITAVQNYREKQRASIYFNHLSAVSESIPALGWVAITPTPAPYIKEMNDAGQFYTNRVLKEWKEKDKIHADWTKAWIQTLSELQAYVKQNHTTGLVWSGTAAPRVGGIPPPPPVGMPPPPPVLDFADFTPGQPKQDRSALFAEINQGENVTKGLKKVTADMQTHKNPAIRAGPAPFKTPSYVTNQSPIPYKAPSPPEKPPKFAREGKRWIIEYQKGNHDLVVSEAEMNNVVYIFKCTDSTVNVKGKVNSIFLDSCKKTAVVFENVVSSCEFVNCQSVQMQVLGKVPTISVDKTDGCQMYLSKDSLDTEIISSKSSEMNVLVPSGSEDFAEYPVPEQFKTIVGRKGLSTTAVENKG